MSVTSKKITFHDKEKSKILIKPTKLFCRIRANLRCGDRMLTLLEHKVLDYILLIFLREGIIRINLSPAEFYKISGYSQPNGKQYGKFYTALRALYDTSLFWINTNYSRCSRIIQDVVLSKKENKITSITVQINPDLCNVLIWQNRNIIQDLVVSMQLKRKYSYFLYLFLLADYITDGQEHQYREMQLRNSLNAPEDQKSKHFKIYIRSAISEINNVTNLNLKVKISKYFYFIWCANENIDVQNEEVKENVDDSDDEYFKKLESEQKQKERMYQALIDNPAIGRLIDEQTGKRRR